MKHILRESFRFLRQKCLLPSITSKTQWALVKAPFFRAKTAHRTIICQFQYPSILLTKFNSKNTIPNMRITRIEWRNSTMVVIGQYVAIFEMMLFGIQCICYTHTHVHCTYICVHNALFCYWAKTSVGANTRDIVGAKRLVNPNDGQFQIDLERTQKFSSSLFESYLSKPYYGKALSTSLQ